MAIRVGSLLMKLSQFGILPLAGQNGVCKMKMSVRVLLVNLILVAISCGLYYVLFTMTEPELTVKYWTIIWIRFFMFFFPVLPFICGYMTFKLKQFSPMDSQVIKSKDFFMIMGIYTAMFCGTLATLLPELAGKPHFIELCIVFAAAALLGVAVMTTLNYFFLILFCDLNQTIRKVADSPQITLKQVQDLIKQYEKYMDAFGLPYLFLFCLVQIMLIASIFNAVKGLVSEDVSSGSISILIVNFGHILSTVSVFCGIEFLIEQSDHAYNSLRLPGAKLLSQYLQATKVREVLELKEAMHLLEQCGKFSAMGFFTIERATLTGLVSTSITYLVVLLQSS